MLKYLVESILTTKKYFFRSFFQKQPGFPLKASQNNRLPFFTLKAGYRTIPLTAVRLKLFQNTVLYTHPKSAKNDAQTKYYEVQWTEIDLETGLMKQSKEPRESIFTDTSGCRFIKSFWQSKNVAYRVVFQKCHILG